MTEQAIDPEVIKKALLEKIRRNKPDAKKLGTTRKRLLNLAMHLDQRGFSLLVDDLNAANDSLSRRLRLFSRNLKLSDFDDSAIWDQLFDSKNYHEEYGVSPVSLPVIVDQRKWHKLKTKIKDAGSDVIHLERIKLQDTFSELHKYGVILASSKANTLSIDQTMLHQGRWCYRQDLHIYEGLLDPDTAQACYVDQWLRHSIVDRLLCCVPDEEYRQQDIKNGVIDVVEKFKREVPKYLRLRRQGHVSEVNEFIDTLVSDADDLKTDAENIATAYAVLRDELGRKTAAVLYGLGGTLYIKNPDDALTQQLIELNDPIVHLIDLGDAIDGRSKTKITVEEIEEVTQELYS